VAASPPSAPVGIDAKLLTFLRSGCKAPCGQSEEKHRYVLQARRRPGGAARIRTSSSPQNRDAICQRRTPGCSMMAHPRPGLRLGDSTDCSSYDRLSQIRVRNWDAQKCPLGLSEGRGQSARDTTVSSRLIESSSSSLSVLSPPSVAVQALMYYVFCGTLLRTTLLPRSPSFPHPVRIDDAWLPKARSTGRSPHHHVMPHSCASAALPPHGYSDATSSCTIGGSIRTLILSVPLFEPTSGRRMALCRRPRDRLSVPKPA
jgi:hypothetical protein